MEVGLYGRLRGIDLNYRKVRGCSPGRMIVIVTFFYVLIKITDKTILEYKYQPGSCYCRCQCLTSRT